MLKVRTNRALFWTEGRRNNEQFLFCEEVGSEQMILSLNAVVSSFQQRGSWNCLGTRWYQEELTNLKKVSDFKWAPNLHYNFENTLYNIILNCLLKCLVGLFGWVFFSFQIYVICINFQICPFLLFLLTLCIMYICIQLCTCLGASWIGLYSRVMKYLWLDLSLRWIKLHQYLMMNTNQTDNMS